MIRRSIVLSLLFIANLISQNTTDITFSTYKQTTLAGTAEVLTVQHTAAAIRNVRFISGYMYCSVACTITLERSGTAATSTAHTIVNLNPNNLNKRATNSQTYHTSNVGVGTVINTYHIPAGGILTIDLVNFQLNSRIADNLSLRSSAVSGDVALGLVWQEL